MNNKSRLNDYYFFAYSRIAQFVIAPIKRQKTIAKFGNIASETHLPSCVCVWVCVNSIDWIRAFPATHLYRTLYMDLEQYTAHTVDVYANSKYDIRPSSNALSTIEIVFVVCVCVCTSFTLGLAAAQKTFEITWPRCVIARIACTLFNNKTKLTEKECTHSIQMTSQDRSFDAD